MAASSVTRSARLVSARRLAAARHQGRGQLADGEAPLLRGRRAHRPERAHLQAGLAGKPVEPESRRRPGTSPENASSAAGRSARGRGRRRQRTAASRATVPTASVPQPDGRLAGGPAVLEQAVVAARRRGSASNTPASTSSGAMPSAEHQRMKPRQPGPHEAIAAAARRARPRPGDSGCSRRPGMIREPVGPRARSHQAPDIGPAATARRRRRPAAPCASAG